MRFLIDMPYFILNFKNLWKDRKYLRRTIYSARGFIGCLPQGSLSTNLKTLKKSGNLIKHAQVREFS